MVERTRRDILEAAVSVLAQKSISDTTLEEIASAAGYAAPSLYSYFENKEDLLRSALRHVAEEVLEAIGRPEGASGPFREQLLAMVRRVFSLAEKRRGFVFQSMGSTMALRPEAKGSVHVEMLAFRKRVLAEVEGLMRQGIAEGALRQEPVEDLALALNGIANAFLMRWVFEGQSLSLEEQANAAVRLFLEGAAPAAAREA